MRDCESLATIAREAGLDLDRVSILAMGWGCRILRDGDGAEWVSLADAAKVRAALRRTRGSNPRARAR